MCAVGSRFALEEGRADGMQRVSHAWMIQHTETRCDPLAVLGYEETQLSSIDVRASDGTTGVFLFESSSRSPGIPCKAIPALRAIMQHTGQTQPT